MPRTARIKSPNSIFHIMSRSISELDLFRDTEDKEKYLSFLKHYQQIFAIKIHAYCLMDNHTHLIVDVNGADVSRVFHGLNFKYAMYYNKKYGRHGHLFQDRFKSKIIDNDGYFARLSAYIHNNPHSMEKYEGCVEQYEYSSLGIYLGARDDKFELVDKGYLLSIFGRGGENAGRLYLEYLREYSNENITADVEFEDECTTYVSQRTILFRNCTAERVIEFLKDRIKVSEMSLMMKSSRKTVEHRAVFSLFLKCFCNYRNKDICGVVGNISQSRVSMLCSQGLRLIMNKAEYQGLMTEFRAVCSS